MNTELLTFLEGLTAKLSPNDALVGSLLLALMVLMTLSGLVKALLSFVRKVLTLFCTSAVQMWNGYDTPVSDDDEEDDDQSYVFSAEQMDQFATLLDSRMDKVEFTLCPGDIAAIKLAVGRPDADSLRLVLAELLQANGFVWNGIPSHKPGSTLHEDG